MRTEYLFYFTESKAYDGDKFLGWLPPHYMLATDFDYGFAKKAGGVDVSYNDGHWREWERQQRLDNMHG